MAEPATQMGAAQNRWEPPLVIGHFIIQPQQMGASGDFFL